MEHQTTNSINNFLRSSITKTRKNAVLGNAVQRCKPLEQRGLPCIVGNLVLVYFDAILIFSQFPYCDDHIISCFSSYSTVIFFNRQWDGVRVDKGGGEMG